MTVLHRPSATAVVPAVGAVVVGLAAGIATLPLQGLLPGAWNTIANSGAMWTLVAFLAGACCGTLRLGALVGLLTLVGEVAGYYAIAAPVDHVATLRSEQVLWTLAALWIGPLAGAGGHLARHGERLHRALATVGMCAVTVGEGLHLIEADVLVAGRVEVVLGGVVALLAVRRLRLAQLAGVLAAGAVVAWSVFVAYRYVR